MTMDSDFILPELSAWRRSVFLKYATQVLEAQQQMTTPRGKNILHYTLKKKRQHEHMSHYPKGDRIDHSTGSQYFYHCHRENFDSAEHGHFHCFIRYKHIPKRIKPIPLPDWDKYIDNPMTHIVAIGMNQFGLPIRMFTVNRWVTSEILYGKEHIPYFLKRYKMTLTDDKYWQVLDKWVEGILHLFSPQIEWLYHLRDQQFERQLIKNPTNNPYSDYELEELSEISIDLTKQIEWIMG